MASVEEIEAFLLMEQEDCTGDFFSRNYLRFPDNQEGPQIGKIIAVYDDGFMVARMIRLGEVVVDRGYAPDISELPLAELTDEVIEVPVEQYGDLNFAFMSSPIVYCSQNNVLFTIFDDGNRNEDVLSEI